MPEFDLTDRGAARAKAVASDAGYVWAAVLVPFCCPVVGLPLFILMLPWYSYRLYCWYQLNDEFSELRYPNSLSPHGLLAANFQSAKWRLIVGVVFGVIYWAVLIVGAATEYNGR
jgi:hypothetical protein